MEVSWSIACILSYFFCLLSSAEGAIRCYCNMPECEETGYTCISHSEKCFSKLYTVYTKNNNTSSGNNQHGCIDLMAPPSGQDSLCDGTGDVVKQMKAFEPLIMCCSDSMCNYRENQDIRVDIIDTPMISSDSHDDDTNVESRKDNSDSVEGDGGVIFKAAVIAVPIAGGLILIVLILMAVRMLREDYNRRSDRHSRLEKAQNFIEHHFTKKDNKTIAQQKHKTTIDSSAKSSSEKLIPNIKGNLSETHSWTECEHPLIKHSQTNRLPQVHKPVSAKHKQETLSNV